MNEKLKNVMQVQAIKIIHDNAQFDSQIEAMSAISFGPGRFAKAASLLRENNLCLYSLSRVAIHPDDTAQNIIGGCRIWPIIDSERNSAFFLGPIVVDRDFQGQGIGASLVSEVVEACNSHADLPIVLVGDMSFFGQFGFEIVPAGLLTLPASINPKRLLWKKASATKLHGSLLRPL